MDMNEIEILRKNIEDEYRTKIEELQQRKEIELSLLDRLATRIKESGLMEKDTRPILRRRRLLSNGQDTTRPSIGARDRLRAAKNKLHGKFTRVDLRNVVNNDGMGEMKEGTFSPNITDLLNAGELILIDKFGGNKPSTYMWADEYKILQEQSSSLNKQISEEEKEG